VARSCLSGGNAKRKKRWLEELTDYLLGFRTEDSEYIQYGPQPYEAIISEICASFGCPPDVAEQQDLSLVQRIFEYRNAQAARDLINQGRKGFEQVTKQPHLVQLLLEMHRAQTGVEHLTSDQMLAGLAQRATEVEREEDE